MAELIRKFDWDDEGDPVMIIRKNRQALTTTKLQHDKPISFAIRLKDAWMYSEEHNPHFEEWMFKVASKVCELFELGLITAQRMAKIATIIQEGIDDLIHMKPRPEQQITAGEVTTTISRGNEGYQTFEKELVVTV